MNVNELKVGDRVGVGGGGGWYQKCEIRTVAKRTATQVVLDDGSRWTTRGRLVGEGASYWRKHLMPEQEAIAQNTETEKVATRKRLIESVESIKFKNVSDDGLKMILHVAKDYQL